MQLIWCLLSNYLNMFRASLCPSSGEQQCALPHMVFWTGSDGCGCVELGCKLCALWSLLFALFGNIIISRHFILCKWDILCFLLLRTEAEEIVEHGASSIGHNVLHTSYTSSVTRKSDLFRRRVLSEKWIFFRQPVATLGIRAFL